MRVDRTLMLELHRERDPHCTCNDCIAHEQRGQELLERHPNGATCQWFARCDRPATGLTPHPVLGQVPTCDRCNQFASQVNDPRR